MIIDNIILEKLESLSMLKIDKDKKIKMKKELSEIINYVDSLKELSLKSINTSHNKKDNINLMSKDNIIDNSHIINNLSTQTKNISNNFFIVPQIIKR